MPPINADELSWTTPDADDAAWRRKQLGAAAGGADLGCSLYELPPGERSWPYHYHAANEEALYVLGGEGTLRLDGESYPLRPGEYAAFPADEPGAHRVVNDGDEVLRYLVVSTMREPDVTVYPDSEKFGVYVGAPPGCDAERSLSGYYRIADDVEYWDGEESG
ncbi:cupin domain-containing protein [Halorubrum salinarum]|uniref:Cupin domain-containing protein n=1 Tax=Halorubrum salinarum TaxID=2739057 RepID=A0A7D3Y1E3_9EURY|nr:cupin domain-containing protein [Halorubrum salinarum]QKG93994.1 cupin domain-containing protein [Halorubrum salinarum]